MSRNALVFVTVSGLLLATSFTRFAPQWGKHDFLAYWSSSHLLATGSNPYDTTALRTLQHSIRPPRPGRGAIIQAWNPPWLLLILLPLGLLPFDLAASVWVFFNTVLIGAAIIISWEMLTDPSKRRGVFVVLLAGLSFGATLQTIIIGQIVGLVLVGLVLGVKGLQSGWHGWAGVVLLLTTIKPHLTYLVLLLIVVWSLRHRRWQVLGGMMAAGLAAGIILWIIFPGWIFAYFRTLLSLPYTVLDMSTLGSFAEALFGFSGLKFAGLLLLPVALPLVRVQARWGWLTATNMALLISVPLAPYGFSFDQIVLLPAIVQIIVWLRRRDPSRRWRWIIGSSLAGIMLVFFWQLILPPSHYHWFVWVPLALLGVYALAWRQLNAQPSTPEN